MASSPLYYKMSVPNPGYIYSFNLSIYQDYIQIRLRSPIPLHTGWCFLYFKIQDGAIIWLEQHKKGGYYSTSDSAAIINFLKALPQNNMKQWSTREILISPIQIARRLAEVQEIKDEELEKLKIKQADILLKKQKIKIFVQSQIKEVLEGKVQCIFCVQILKPQKYHQLKCGHCFHYQCIKHYCQQIKNQCPVCKYSPRRR